MGESSEPDVVLHLGERPFRHYASVEPHLHSLVSFKQIVGLLPVLPVLNDGLERLELLPARLHTLPSQRA